MTSLLSKLDPQLQERIRARTAEVPVKLGQIASDLGLVVRVGTLRPGVSGEIMRSDEAPSGYVIRINRHEKKERQRFTLAHEISHFLLHRHLIGDGISDDILYRSSLSNSVEAEANRGAADLLMPSNVVINKWQKFGSKRDEQTIKDLADLFGVSAQAMAIRLGI